LSNTKLCFIAAFLSRDEALGYRDKIYEQIADQIKDGTVILVEDEVKMINAHHVVQMLAVSPQLEMDLD